MALNGNWTLTMSTPLGERKASLCLKNSGGTLTGTQGVEGASSEIFDGHTSGDDVAWKVSIKIDAATKRQDLRPMTAVGQNRKSCPGPSHAALLWRLYSRAPLSRISLADLAMIQIV